MKRLIILVGLMVTMGCASLHISPSDSTGTKAAKVLARVPVAAVTLGLSELWHVTQRDMEAWVGRSEEDLYLFWGEPTRVTETEHSKTVTYVFERKVYTPAQAHTYTSGSAYCSGKFCNGSATSTTVITPAHTDTYRKYRTFRIVGGFVTDFSWRGL